MTKELTRILIEEGIVTTIWLNRPEVHNAMDDVMISELTGSFKELSSDENIRAIILRGKGKSFCAGADLNYMKSIAGFGFEENVRDGKKLADLFRSIYDFPAATLALVHGSAFGGANGLLSACDIVIAETNTTFAFSEVKLGISPATISPFVIRRIGEYGAKELMLTGKRFKSAEAEKWHLVNHVADDAELEETLQKSIRQILSSGPRAVRETKELIGKVIDSENLDDIISYTTQMIARLRASEEGQEGMASFLEKRKAKWQQ